MNADQSYFFGNVDHTYFLICKNFLDNIDVTIFFINTVIIFLLTSMKLFFRINVS